MPEKTETSSSNNRWWESYLVRYLLGFIIGSICVTIIALVADVIPEPLALMQNTAKAIDNESKLGGTSSLIIVALLGLAYCYIASTPITVLHAGRYSRGAVERLSRFFWLGWTFALAFSMIAPLVGSINFDKDVHIYLTFLVLSTLAIALWAFFRFRDKVMDSSSPDKYKKIDYLLVIPFSVAIWSMSQAIPLLFGVRPQIEDVRLLALGAPVIWIGIVQYFVLFKIHWSETANYDFYKKLFAARQLGGAKDVRDTYSHLREHSNAIFIVGVEISILALVTGSIRVQRGSHSISHSPLDSATFWLCALGIWIVPTIFMWSRANAMERYFADNPDHFIGKNE